jgi:UDP:flavonoid glycosyltransferase YjiC (YdhE family)
MTTLLFFNHPVLCIPQLADQPWVARRVVKLGAGKMLRRSRVHAQRIRRLAEEILTHSSYAQASARLGKTLREAGGYMRPADEIQQFLHRTSSYAVPTPQSRQEAFFNMLINLTL